MPLYEITSDRIKPVENTRFDIAGLHERADLQRLLRKQIDVVLKDALVVAEEFGEWEDSKRRIDLLAIDKKANLVVIELKRTEDGGHMELQALRYAAMVSTLTFEGVVDVYQRFLSSLGDDTVDASDAILKFLDWEEPRRDEFGQDVSIVLVSSNFSKELTGAVLWLNDRELDIRCIRMVPYQDGERILVDVQQIIPLPEAEAYQVKIRDKEQGIKKERSSHTALQKFWHALLAAGRRRDPALHDRFSLSTATRSYLGATTGVRGVGIWYVANKFERRAELYIDNGNQEENKRLFEQLLNRQAEIEQAFGERLTWLDLPQKQACRIFYVLPSDEFRDQESLWPEMHEAMISAMIRFEQAFRPALATLHL